MQVVVVAQVMAKAIGALAAKVGAAEEARKQLTMLHTTEVVAEVLVVQIQVGWDMPA
jgi:hypothetical protein